MNLLDLLIIVAAAAAAAAGARLGFVTRAAGWTGMVIGLVLAARVAPSVAERVGDADPSRVLVVVACTLLIGALLGQLGGQLIGHRVGVRNRSGWRARADRTFGAASGLVAVLAAVWLLTPTLAQVPDWPSRQARGSFIVAAIDDVTPDPPNPLRTLSGLVSEVQWTRLLAELDGSAKVGPPPTAVVLSDIGRAQARAATVRISHSGCGLELDGTGFALGDPDMIVTSAHVVAGHARLQVHADRGGDHGARVIYFDPKEDLAVLYAPGLGLEALELGETEVHGEGVVFGHPRGAEEISERAFRIDGKERLRTGTIYDEDADVSREVALVSAYLEPGDSGSALFGGADNKVVGVAWAVARDRSGIALASTTEQVAAAIKGAHEQLAADPNVDLGTERCIPSS